MMKLHLYIYALFLGMGHTAAKHMVYHDAFEKWILVKFDEDSDILHYLSVHKVTCTKCGYTKIRKKAWIRKSSWPRIGDTVHEAFAKAMKYQGD